MALTKEEKDELYHGKKRTKKELEALRRFAGPSLDRVAKINAIKKRREADARDRYLQERQGGKYEAMNRAGEAKSAADRERHMKLVLGDDWKPSDEGRLNRDRILAKMDKRNRALDPENDQELLSGLRNRLGIMPTAAENERQIMAKNAAKREQARLSEGEAGGSLAGSAAERIRDARRAREARLRKEELQKKRHEDYRVFSSGKGALEVAQEPTTGGLEGLGMEAIRKENYDKLTASDLDREEGTEKALKDAYLTDKGARQFKTYKREDEPKEEEGMIASVLRKGGEGIDSIKDHLSGATAHKEGAEAAYASHQGMGVDRRLQEAADEKKAPWAKLREDEIAKKKADALINQETTLDSTEMDSEALDDWQQDKASDLTSRLDEIEPLGPDKIEQAGAIDEAVTNQEEAQQAIRDASPEDQKAISEEIAKVKGHGPEWVESKEATGNYVSYEGSGLVINMASLGKDIQRNRNMEMLKHIPAANRPAMLVEWGYIDKGDLSTMQQKSAKELKELSLLDLRIAETQGKIEKNKNSMGEKQKLQYTAANKGMQQALKDKDYALAEVYRNELNTIMPTGDTSNFQELIDKGIKRGRIKTPLKVFKAAGLKDGDKYYDSALSISKSVNFLKTSSGSTRSTKFEELLGQTAIDPVTGKNKGTYGEFLKNQGIYQWNDVKNVDPSQYDIPKWAVTSEENYMKWALPQIQDRLMTGIWGNIHQQVQQYNGTQVAKKQEELSQKVTTYDDTELTSDAQALRGEVPKAPSTGTGTGDPELQKPEKKKRKSTAVEKVHKGSKSRKMHQYDNFTKRAEDAEKELANMRDALTEEEIGKIETRIANYRKRAQEFKTAGEEADKKITKEQERDKLHKELKAYNKKREKAGIGWIRIDEYKRLKKEGKI